MRVPQKLFYAERRSKPNLESSIFELSVEVYLYFAVFGDNVCVFSRNEVCFRNLKKH